MTTPAELASQWAMESDRQLAIRNAEQDLHMAAAHHERALVLANCAQDLEDADFDHFCTAHAEWKAAAVQELRDLRRSYTRRDPAATAAINALQMAVDLIEAL